jgi:hypothetical protein
MTQTCDAAFELYGWQGWCMTELLFRWSADTLPAAAAAAVLCGGLHAVQTTNVPVLYCTCRARAALSLCGRSVTKASQTATVITCMPHDVHAFVLFFCDCRLQPIRGGMLPVVPEAIARAEARRSNPGQTVDMPTWEVCVHASVVIAASHASCTAFNFSTWLQTYA